MKMYMVGQQIPTRENPERWELQGIFSTVEKAVVACRTRNFFYTEMTMDEELPLEYTPAYLVFPIDPMEGWQEGKKQ